MFELVLLYFKIVHLVTIQIVDHDDTFKSLKKDHAHLSSVWRKAPWRARSAQYCWSTELNSASHSKGSYEHGAF